MNNAQSPQRGRVAPIKAFMGKKPFTPICTFLRTSTAQKVSVDEGKLENVLNVKRLKVAVAALQPFSRRSWRKFAWLLEIMSPKVKRQIVWKVILFLLLEKRFIRINNTLAGSTEDNKSFERSRLSGRRLTL